jgi:hypothetical protein
MKWALWCLCLLEPSEWSPGALRPGLLRQKVTMQPPHAVRNNGLPLQRSTQTVGKHSPTLRPMA